VSLLEKKKDASYGTTREGKKIQRGSLEGKGPGTHTYGLCTREIDDEGLDSVAKKGIILACDEKGRGGEKVDGGAGWGWVGEKRGEKLHTKSARLRVARKEKTHKGEQKRGKEGKREGCDMVKSIRRTLPEEEKGEKKTPRQKRAGSKKKRKWRPDPKKRRKRPTGS